MATTYKVVEVAFPGSLQVVEAVGRVEKLGPNVSKWEIGQRVGIGFLGGQDGHCEHCLRGDFVNCLNPVISGVTTDGGYAEVMLAEARALASIPEELSPNVYPYDEGKAGFRMVLVTGQ
jgi:D-arabinose 1-dehydrogenase-like Zn-dependent alcohol dehydrogenase